MLIVNQDAYIIITKTIHTLPDNASKNVRITAEIRQITFCKTGLLKDALIYSLLSLMKLLSII
jgi:hypothetical protein